MSSEIITQMIGLVGFSATCGGLIYIGRRLQILDALQSDMGKVKHNLKAVADFLIGNFCFDPKELVNYSPLALTSAGRALVEQIGFAEAFRGHQADFFGYIDEEEPKFRYDVELAAIRSIYTLVDRPYMDFLKVYLYAHPARSVGNVAPTLGVYVRDQYLAKHPEITE
jgi:hypothetical protein